MAFPQKTPAVVHESEKKSVGKGVFQKCAGCQTVLAADELRRLFHVCPHCGHHHPMSPAEWRTLLLDDAKLEPWDEHISPGDPIEFNDGRSYPDRIRAARQKTQASEGIEIGRGKMFGDAVGYGLFVFAFMGGSMGSVVGERITRLFERCHHEKLPVVLLHASGGARMQEGILSLMQMAKTVSALARFRECRKPFISVCLHPTTGGVAASTAFLGDVNVVEPGALIGFAGPRVIEGTIRQKLPAGFQRSEFLLEHGMIDTIVPRSEMKSGISGIVRLLSDGGKPRPSRAPRPGAGRG